MLAVLTLASGLIAMAGIVCVKVVLINGKTR